MSTNQQHMSWFSFTSLVVKVARILVIVVRGISFYFWSNLWDDIYAAPVFEKVADTFANEPSVRVKAFLG